MQIGKHSRKLIELRKALHHGTVTPDGLLPIEGPILLEEARRSRLEIIDIFVRTGAAAPSDAGSNVHDVPADLFKTLHDTETSQGIIATVRPRNFTVADIVKVRPALLAVLCRLQDPGNAGTILRVGEAFGATGCIALKGTVGFHNSKVVRASAGSIFRLPHAGGADPGQLFETLKANQIRIVGAAPAAASTIDEWDWRQPTAVLIGNEGSGLNDEEQRWCDAMLRIPQQSSVESLNSAIATAVTLYEAAKQRRAL